MGREKLNDKSKVSITRLSKYFCLTVPAAKKVLIEAGYLNQDGKPNPEAISSGAAEQRTAEDGNTYLVWHFASVKQHFKEPSDVDISCFFKNRYDLENRILRTLSEMGHLVRSDDAILTVRIPAQAGHGFQRNLDSDSNGSWTAIPRQAGQLEAVA